jgi:ribosome-associated protein
VDCSGGLPALWRLRAFFIAAAAAFALRRGNMSQTTPETIVIRAEPIELSQLLKFAGVFGTGGEAKFAINSGEVTVNGTVELQARKKILGGQTVVVEGRTLLVKLGEASAVKVKPAAKAAGKPPATSAAKSDAKAPAKAFTPPGAKSAAGGGGGFGGAAKPASGGGAQAWAGAPKGARSGGQPGKPASSGAFAKPVFGAAKPARATKPVSRDRDDDGYEDESPREKPAASAASQRTFFYTELLKKQQGQRKKH